MDKNTQQQLALLQDGVRKAAPLVADFFDLETPLQQYVEELHAFMAHPLHRQRQQQLKHVVQQLLQRTFTQAELEKANVNYETDWKINIVDHHGVLNHPILFGANIIANIHQLPAAQPRGIVVLSDSGVPMNNDFHKRGIQFHGKQLNIFPSRVRHRMSYASPIQTEWPLVEAMKRHEHASTELVFLERMQEEVEGTANQHGVENYMTQIQRLNYQLWPQLFAQDIRSHVPDLLYVSHEEVAHEMLKLFLHDKQSIFYKILCVPEMRAQFVEAFDSVVGCWQQEGEKGTVFFWGLTDVGEKVRMRLEGNVLVSENSDVALRVELTPESICSAISEKKIYATMFVVYGISMFYCGVRPLVGFGSMNYQTHMKKQWIQVMQTVDTHEVELLESISTTGFIGGPKVTFAYEQGRYTDLYALDVIERGGLTGEYVQRLRKMPLNALIQPALIDIYDIYVPKPEQIAITVTSGDLMGESFEWLRTMQV